MREHSRGNGPDLKLVSADTGHRQQIVELARIAQYRQRAFLLEERHARRIEGCLWRRRCTVRHGGGSLDRGRRRTRHKGLRAEIYELLVNDDRAAKFAPVEL